MCISKYSAYYSKGVPGNHSLWDINAEIHRVDTYEGGTLLSVDWNNCEIFMCAENRAISEISDRFQPCSELDLISGREGRFHELR